MRKRDSFYVLDEHLAIFLFFANVDFVTQFKVKNARILISDAI